MKPVTILIPLLAMLCGCDGKRDQVSRQDIEDISTCATNPYPCWQIDGVKLIPIYDTNYGIHLDQ